jgi:hypothetical protein
MSINTKTSEPIQSGNFAATTAEFGRTEDVEKIYGLKRGTLYNLFSQRKIRGSLLRIKGQLSGVRLWDMGSIRQYIEAEMTNEEATHHDN